MGNLNGNVSYNYKVNIDMARLVERMIGALPGENIEWYFDDESLVIYQNIKTKYSGYSYPATQYEPSCEDIELDIDIDYVDVAGDIKQELKDIKTDNIPYTVTKDDVTEWEFEE